MQTTMPLGCQVASLSEELVVECAASGTRYDSAFRDHLSIHINIIASLTRHPPSHALPRPLLGIAIGIGAGRCLNSSAKGVNQ